MKFLALSDSIEMFKLIYSKLIADDQNYFLERILIYSNYNSKLFAYVLNNYPLTIQRGEYRTRELIKYKSYMDFAGLATICQNPDFILTENSYYGYAKTIEDILRTTKNM